MRNPLLVALFVALVPAVATAQDINFPNAAVKALKDSNQFYVPVSNPPESSPLPATDQLASSELGQNGRDKLLHGTVTFHGPDDVDISDDVIFLARGYRVTCDRAYGNLKTQIFTLQGNVHVDGTDFTLRHAGSVTIDFIHGSYVAFNGNAQLAPSALQGHFTDNLYVKGQESFGNQRETTTLESDATTCNKDDPHYDIEAASTVLRPGHRIIFRKAKLRIFGYTVFRIPYLSIPLDERQYKNTPYVGQSPEEGYFIKWQYQIPLKNPNYAIDTREEYMTKLGLGLGVGYQYASTKDAGTASIYHIFGSSDELDVTESHRQAFNWGTISIDNDYERDNHLSNPDSTIFNTKFGVVVPEGTRATEKLNYTGSFNDAYGTSSSSQGVMFEDQRTFGLKTQTTLDLNYFETGSQYASSIGGESSTQNTQRMDVHLQAAQDLDKATATMEYQRSIPIGTTQNFIGSEDETPVITLNSDARRIFGSKVGQDLPFTTQLSWGDFQDPETNSPISRGYFSMDFNKVDTSQNRLKMDLSGDFKQGIYSDDTAEYVLGLGTNIRYDLGPDTGLNLRYNYLRPYGYSPLAIDQTGETNFVSGDLNFRPVKPLLIGAQTGYDLVRLQEHMVAWQQLGLRSEYTPTKYILFRGLYTYDTLNGQFQNANLDLTYLPGATKVSVSTQYDGPSHTFSTATLFVQGLKWGKTTMSTAMTYNGYLKKFDSQQFNFIYDLHCVDAVLEVQQSDYGFQSGRAVSFYLRIKALPFDTPFGAGTRGQPIGVGTGSTF